MDYVNNIITSSDADVFFGNNMSLRNLTLASTLRFIALKHHQGEIETLKAIKAESMEFYTHNSGNAYAQHAKDNGIELLILTAPRGAQLLTITEDGWASLDTPPYPVAPFLSAASETRVYSNAAIKSTVIIVRQATDKWIDKLCSSLFRVLPWYFEGGMSDDETALFKSISKGDAETFNSIINNLCAPYDFKSSRFKKTLIGWNDGYRKKQIATLQNNIKSLHNSVTDYQQNIERCLRDIEMSSTNLLALQAQGNSADDSVYKFFMSHSNIVIHKTTLGSGEGNVMEYAVLDTIEYYDSDAFLRLYKNTGSSIGGADENVKKILYAVFADNKGVFKVESMFKLTNLSSLNVMRHSRTGKYEKTHLAHPHLVHYGCLGGNSSYISNFLQQGNWDMAIEQSVAATKNINFGDAVVISQFVSDVRRALDYNNCKCIIADNGTEMTPAEFLAYISENNENEDATNG